MKRIALIISWVICGFIGFAQTDETKGEDSKKIQAMEVAYITKELNLSPEEAEKFWPIFNKYRGDAKAVIGDRTITDPLDRQQKILDLRKKYRTEFTRVLTNDRGNRVFPAEDQFRQMVRRELLKRQNERRQINQGKRGG